MRAAGSALLAGVVFLGAAAEIVPYVDITAKAKLNFRQQGSPTSQKYLIETMGGGVAMLDYDNDGRLDIFFVNGARLDDPMPPSKTPDKSDPAYWNRLYHQEPDGTFIDVSEKAGVTGASHGIYGMGVAVGDYDNDGFADLFVTGYGGVSLYHNNGNGTFADVTTHAGVRVPGWTSSAGFFDFDNDGKLDIMVGRYVQWTFTNNRHCGDTKAGARAYCHPDNFEGVTNVLYRNNGDGTFTDVSEKAGIVNPSGKTLGLAFADYDGDGWTDVYVANDSVQCFLYRNNRNGTFSEVSLTAGVGFNEDGSTFAGMGTDFADYDNDGRPDIFVTALSDQRYVLFHNNGDGTFSDVTSQTGIGRATLDWSGWSTRFLDYDNDGWKDIFVAQGHVMDTITLTNPNRSYMQAPLLLQNRNGRFTKVNSAPDLTKRWAGRGAAFGDIDNDGDVDIVVSNLNQNAYILRNEAGHQRNWLRLQLRGTRSNRDGIGATVVVTGASGNVQYYAVQTAVGYQSASDKRLIVGLGSDAAAKQISIRWPSGVVQKLENVKARQTLTITEPNH